MIPLGLPNGRAFTDICDLDLMASGLPKIMAEHMIFRSSDRSLEAATDAAAKFLNNAVKPVLVGGVKLRPQKAEEAFLEFANACGETRLASKWAPT